MTRRKLSTTPPLERLRRRIRLICLVVVPIMACTMTALSLWGDSKAGKPFEPHAIYSGLGMIGWALVVYVLSRPALDFVERMRDRNDKR